MKTQRFSLRKYKTGLVSVVLAAIFLQPNIASANENSTPAVAEAAIEVVADPVEEAPVEADTTLPSEGEVAEESAVETPAEEVVEATEAEETATEVETPTSTTSTSAAEEIISQPVASNIEIVGAKEAWEQGYTGAGTIVAIIDSGIDVEHDALTLPSLENAKYKSKEEMEAAMKAAGIDYGQWYSDKVVYAYNYFDGNTNVKENEQGSHGMHVSTTAAGSPTTAAPNGLTMYGVAPEAQVMFLRVFSDQPGGSSTSTPIYVRAIEDAVKLGADSINLSLGGANGSTINSSPALIEAIRKASAAGVTVVMAAGNDGAFGDGFGNPSAENPDYGLVGSPSTSRDTISVAAIRNTTVSSEVASIVVPEGEEGISEEFFKFSNGGKAFDAAETYEYAFAGIGTAEDVASVDLTNKVALIQRGSITFTEKIVNAMNAGAIGVIIFNNQAGTIGMALEDEAKEIPSVSIEQAIGEELKKAWEEGQNLQIQFKGETRVLPNSNPYQLTDFTSWGLSADGELKPDITAPGQGIYAAINDGLYEDKQGTSMASPHVAGLAALMKQYLQTTYPDKSAEEIQYLVKAILMSTAIPHFNEENQAYTSPRQQGAGVANVGAAIKTPLYVTGRDGYGSISLGNVGDKFVLKLTVHNLSDQDQTLTYVTDLNTDAVEEGYFTLAPRFLAQVAGEEITVKANSSEDIEIALDASEFAESLLEDMPNGYYLEGFVRFLNTDNEHVISLPYVGFRGEFQNLSVFEETIYSLIENGKAPFYGNYYRGGIITDPSDLTALLTVASGKRVVLGSYQNDAGYWQVYHDENGELMLALSPNGDNEQDVLGFQGVALRSFNTMIARVYAKEDANFESPLWESDSVGGNKHYYGNRQSSSELYNDTIWDGTDQNGNALEDGHYVYVLSFYSDVPGADEQELRFNILLDRQAPIITTATYDAETRTFLARDRYDQGISGIRAERIYYTIDGQKIYIDQEADGSFILPEGVDHSFATYEVIDFAGNRSSMNVGDLISIGNEAGRLTVSKFNVDSNSSTSVVTSYIIRDSQGNIVPLDNTNAGEFTLAFGDYTIEVLLYYSDYYKLVSPKVQSFTISEENSLVNVQFDFAYALSAPITVDLSQELPEGTVVKLVREDGTEVILPLQRYGKGDYGKDIPEGDYTIVIDLPAGYEILEDDFTVSVVYGKNTRKKLTLVNKNPLLEAIETANATLESAAYFNAKAGLAKAFELALEAAKETAGQTVNQAAVDKALEALVTAAANLDGQETDLTALNTAIARAEDVKASQEYVYTDAEKQRAYDAALAAAQLVVAGDTTTVTQAEVDAALKALEKAEADLDGVNPVTERSRVITESIAFQTIYIDDPDLEVGQEVVEQEGENGVLEIKITNTYVNGVYQSTKHERTVTKEAVDRIIRRGTKSVVKRSRVITESIAFNTVYIDDPNLEAGQEVVEQEGENGVLEIKITNTYVNGLYQSTTHERTVVKAAVDRIVRRGTKVVEKRSRVITEAIAFETIYIDDATLEAGQEIVEQEGINGVLEIKITNTYANGIYQSTTHERTILHSAIARIIRRGVKA